MEFKELLKYPSAIYYRVGESQLKDFLEVAEDLIDYKRLEREFEKVRKVYETGKKVLENLEPKEAGLFFHKFALLSTKEFLRKPLTVFATLLGLKIGIPPDLLIPLEVRLEKLPVEFVDDLRFYAGTIGFKKGYCYIALSEKFRERDFMELATTLLHELIHYKLIVKGIIDGKSSKEVLELARDYSPSFEKEHETYLKMIFPETLMLGPNFLINIAKIALEQLKEKEK